MSLLDFCKALSVMSSFTSWLGRSGIFSGSLLSWTILLWRVSISGHSDWETLTYPLKVSSRPLNKLSFVSVSNLLWNRNSRIRSFLSELVPDFCYWSCDICSKMMEAWASSDTFQLQQIIFACVEVIEELKTNSGFMLGVFSYRSLSSCSCSYDFLLLPLLLMWSFIFL